MKVLYEGCKKLYKDTYDGVECAAHEPNPCDSLYDSPTCAGYDQ